jgi:signal transduction histidine kinase
LALAEFGTNQLFAEDRGPIDPIPHSPHRFQTKDLEAARTFYTATSRGTLDATSSQRLSGPQRTGTDMLRLNRALLSMHSAMPNTGSKSKLQDVLDAFVQELASLLSADVCVVVGPAANNQDIAVTVDWRWINESIPPEYREEHFFVSKRILDKAKRDTSDLSYSLGQPDLDQRLKDYMQRSGIGTLVVQPLAFQEQTIGLVKITDQGETRVFTDRELFAVKLLANVAASLLINAQLNRRLVTANASLKESNKELDTFASSVSHDLKGPLANFIGFAHFLKDYHATMPPDELDESLGYIVQSGYRMLEVVDEMLVLASIKQEDVEIEPIDMAAAVNEVQMRLAPQIELYQAELIVPSSWPGVLGKQTWVQQVLINLVSNAIKYGGQPPLVELGAEAQNGDKVRFWVRDNGKGLTPEQQAKLFSPFERLEQKSTDGHGLGLTIVRQILEKLGGEIGVESEVGVGSIFHFTLPTIGESDWIRAQSLNGDT